MTDAFTQPTDAPAEGDSPPETPQPDAAPADDAPPVAAPLSLDGAGDDGAGADAALTTGPVEEDTRQLWYCVDPYGPRTRCAPYRSNAHLNPGGSDLSCPNCGNRTAIRAEQYDAAGGPPPPVVAA